MNRSVVRFSSSPFAVNVIGLEEISEYKRNFDIKVNKSKKPPKTKRKISDTREQKFLAKLRNEVKVIENSKVYADEKRLEASLPEKHKFSNTYEFSSKSKQRSRESDGFSVNSKGALSSITKTGNRSSTGEKNL